MKAAEEARLARFEAWFPTAHPERARAGTVNGFDLEEALSEPQVAWENTPHPAVVRAWRSAEA